MAERRSDDWYSRSYPQSPLTDQQRGCLRVLERWRPLYNIYRHHTDAPHGGFEPCAEGIIVHLQGGETLSTWDCNGLTVLVVAAHELAYRVQLSAHLPASDAEATLMMEEPEQYLYGLMHMDLMIHPRVHDGTASMFQRHPTAGQLAARALKTMHPGRSHTGQRPRR